MVNGSAETVGALGFDTGATTVVSPDFPHALNRTTAKHVNVNAFMVSRDVVMCWDVIVGSGRLLCIIEAVTDVGTRRSCRLMASGLPWETM